MRAYELMVIFDGDLDEPAVDEPGQAGRRPGRRPGAAHVATTDRWGRRRFAYEIDHKTEGYYVVLEIAAEAATSTTSSGPCASRTRSSATSSIRLPDREAARRGLLGDGRPSRPPAG